MWCAIYVWHDVWNMQLMKEIFIFALYCSFRYKIRISKAIEFISTIALCRKKATIAQKTDLPLIVNSQFYLYQVKAHFSLDSDVIYKRPLQIILHLTDSRHNSLF